MTIQSYSLKTKVQYILSFIAMGILPFHSHGQAKKDSTVIHLNEVVVESQQADSRKLLPSSLSVINRTTLRISPQTNILQEAEQATPGLFITGKGIMGAGAGPLSSGKISMRGLMSSSNSSTQVLIDGVPMMMGLFGHPLTDAIEQSNVERIEVLRGPSSLQYGGSALAGAINFISTNPAPKSLNLVADMQWGSFGTVKRSFSTSVGREKFFLQAGYSHNATDGFRDNSAFTSDDYFFRYGLNITKNFQRVISVYRSNATTNDPGSVDAPSLNTTHVQRTLASYKLINNYRNLKSVLTLYYQEGINHFSDGWNSKDYLGGGRLEEQFSLFKGNAILAGAEARWFGGKGSPVGFPTSTLNDVWIRQTGQAAFVVLQQKAGDALLLNAGIRTDHHSLLGYTTSPSLGGSYSLSKSTTVRGLFSTGFRYPTIGELYYFPVANRELKTEKAGNIEVGLNTKSFSNRFFVDLTLFSTTATDLIITVPAPAGSVPPVKNLNAKKVSNSGLELSSRLILGDIEQQSNIIKKEKQTNNSVFTTAQLSLNYMYLQQNNTPLPYSPKHKLNLQIQSSVRKLLINLEYQLISGMYTDFPAVTKTKYSVMDLALIYPLMRKIQLKVTANNLFDEKYQIMKGYPMPGRILMGGFTINL